MENNNNSFVVTVTPITNNSDFNTTTEKAMQVTEKKTIQKPAR